MIKLYSCHTVGTDYSSQTSYQMKVARVENALVVSSFIAVEDGTNKENL